MKGLVWWLRSAFCRHEWAKVGTTKVYLHRASDGTRIFDTPEKSFDVKECAKCGWIWRQHL
jgi:hypothetical protein